jgi:hypothetical protein
LEIVSWGQTHRVVASSQASVQQHLIRQEPSAEVALVQVLRQPCPHHQLRTHGLRRPEGPHGESEEYDFLLER